MVPSTKELGNLIRQTRRRYRITQQTLAMVSGTGLRFIIELEKGKVSCQVGKVLTVLQSLGIEVSLRPPASDP